MKISEFKHSFEYLSPYALLKKKATTGKPRFHGSQQMIHLLIPSLLASFKRRLSEFRVVKCRYFLCKEERNSKVSPRKVKANSVNRFGQFLKFSLLHLLQLSMYNSP